MADLHVEGTLAVPGATVDLAQQLARLAPFGNGNAEPAFVLPRAQVVRADRIGRDGNTCAPIVQGEGGGPRLKPCCSARAKAPLAQALLTAAYAACTWPGTCGRRNGRARVTAGFFIADAAPAA